MKNKNLAGAQYCLSSTSFRFMNLMIPCPAVNAADVIRRRFSHREAATEK